MSTTAAVTFSLCIWKSWLYLPPRTNCNKKVAFKTFCLWIIIHLFFKYFARIWYFHLPILMLYIQNLLGHPVQDREITHYDCLSLSISCEGKFQWVVSLEIVFVKMNFTSSSFGNTSALVTSFGSIVITILGLVSNALTLFVILKSSKLKSNCIAPLICALGVSDITFCLELILVSVQFYENEAFSDGSFWCFFTTIFYR